MGIVHQERLDVFRGASLLAFDAVEQVSRIVEAMHANIAAGSAPLGAGTDGRARGISSAVYDATRFVNRACRTAVDYTIGPVSRRVSETAPQLRSDAVASILNGVMGDHLLASDNPLAIKMRLRRNGEALPIDRDALAAAIPNATGKILVVVHGLCMNDHQWNREGHDHAASLASERDETPLYLHYNSGRHISENGRELADLLEDLLASWPIPVTELSVLGHSMGGLVARSAYHYGVLAKHRWPAALTRIVFLGTPHHGAPIERAGQSLVKGLGISPYTAPFARLGWLRSAGITDLRYGNLIDEDWLSHDRFASTGDPRGPVHSPSTEKLFAIAATTGRRRGDAPDRLLGDGLVPVASALGLHAEAEKALGIPESRRALFFDMNHMELLSDSSVYAQIRDWQT